MSNHSRIAKIIFTLTICATCVGFAVGQTPAEGRQLPVVFKYDGDMAHLLAQLPEVYGSTIGLEVDPRQPRSTVGFYLKEPSLSDVLNAITKSSLIYQWREKDGFIEVLPLQGSSPLLDTHISNFRVDYADEAEAITQLVNLPEVQASMNAMRLRYQDRANASTTGSGKKMSFTLENVTVRQVLNKIADENGTRFWTLKKNSAGIFSISTAPIRG